MVVCKSLGVIATPYKTLIVATFTCIFLILGNSLPVYATAVTGAIYEILWLPAWFLLLIIPVIAILAFFRTRQPKRSIFLVAAFLPLLTITIILISRV